MFNLNISSRKSHVLDLQPSGNEALGSFGGLLEGSNRLCEKMRNLLPKNAWIQAFPKLLIISLSIRLWDSWSPSIWCWEGFFGLLSGFSVLSFSYANQDGDLRSDCQELFPLDVILAAPLCPLPSFWSPDTNTISSFLASVTPRRKVKSRLSFPRMLNT